MKLPPEPDVLGPFRGHVAIDWDGTLVSWNDADGRESGVWLEGAQDALRAFVAANIGVIVHSCRTTWVDGGGAEQIATILHEAGFAPFIVQTEDAGGSQQQVWSPWKPETEAPLAVGEYPPERPRIGIWCGLGKPIAWAYIDDRGVHFTTWEQVAPIILEHAQQFVFTR